MYPGTSTMEDEHPRPMNHEPTSSVDVMPHYAKEHLGQVLSFPFSDREENGSPGQPPDTKHSDVLHPGSLSVDFNNMEYMPEDVNDGGGSPSGMLVGTRSPRGRPPLSELPKPQFARMLTPHLEREV